MFKEYLIDALLGIDEEASLLYGEMEFKHRVVIVGGAAFLLHDLTARNMTHDIDVLMADEQIRDIISHYPNVNRSVASYTDQIPYGFEGRLVLLDLQTKAVEFATPCVEDLVVMKLYADRPADLLDIDGAAEKGLVDWGLLERLVYDADEAPASALAPRRYREMVDAYERFKARCEG